MANYELLALNESTPQLVAPTASDTGVVTNLTVTTNLTATAGTANGVVYLNGSKVQTSGAGLRFDGTNLGLGVTPSAWGNNYKTVQLGEGSAITGFLGNQQTFLTSNAYHDGVSWKYISTSGAGYYQLAGVGNGTHTWCTAPSGTAGNAITFTQVMDVDASGNVTIGVGDLIVTTPTTPASAAATGTAGTIAWDANYMYVCVATNTWKRVAIATWP